MEIINLEYMQLTNDMFELVVADKTLVQEQVNTSIMQSHSYYTSHKLTEEYSVREESTPGYDCAIED
ncbi:unnamed protein product [Rhizophagus irregularis]|nr:unnamed protein product [Rhizophagus irregularis]